MVWVDKGKTAPFYNKKFLVLGKPDLMYRQKKGILAVEYKSRNANIYDADIVQVKVASLAARGSGHKVYRALIKTKKTERYIDLPKSDEQLYLQVRDYVEKVRQAKRGDMMDALPGKYKCQSCAYSQTWQKRV